jgi:hypothetical protein
VDLRAGFDAVANRKFLVPAMGGLLFGFKIFMIKSAI